MVRNNEEKEKGWLSHLKTMALCLVLVVSIEHLDLDVLVEGIVKGLAALDVQRDVCDYYLFSLRSAKWGMEKKKSCASLSFIVIIFGGVR